MASRKFDFGKLKRSFYTTTLKDGTVLMVNMPEKRVFERMQSITEVEEDEDIKYNDLLTLLAEILSNNKAGKEITTEYLENEKYDIEELVEYLKDYGQFVNSLKNNPN